MKKQKILAVIMAVVIMAASMPVMTLQADSISKEAQACKELGILIGADASGVTSQYLSTTPTRIQAFIIVLRLKGLYAEASDFEGDDNFTDALTAGWAKNYMAYAKSNSELGWGGYPDGTFAPADKINGQAFYKVMLETLGYKQGIDFTYADTLKFAEEIGLAKNANDIARIKSFTVNDIAKGIYNALNTKPADTDKKLISVMVEKNIISSGKAISAGFTLDTKEAKVTRFEAVSNSRIELEFDKDILLQKGDVEISKLGSNSRLSVLNVESHGKTASVTTTEATPFNAYELTINTLIPTNNMVIKGYKNKYVAMPKDTTKPVAKHELLGRNEIVVTYSEAVDKSSAENLSNYDIEKNVVILSAELGASGKTVLLKTTDMSSFHKLIVRNVADVSGNKMTEYTALFEGGKSDTQGPSIVTVKSEDNTTVAVTFSKVLDQAAAEDIGNYSIDKDISIIAAELDESRKQVTLTTTQQEPGDTYKLTVQDVTDTWGNVMFKKEYRFTGDSSKLTATVLAVSNNEVMVSFNKAVSKITAEDTDNYSIDKKLKVEEAILDAAGKTVTLITSDQTLREVYTITISGVSDLWGNEISASAAKFGGMAVNDKELTYTVKSNGSSLTVTYSKRVDKESAENVFNYYLDEKLGYAAKATLDEADGRTVTLLTAEQKSGNTYAITIKDVKDISGKRISTDARICTKKFAGINTDELNEENGELLIETVVTVDVNTVDLIFSDELTQDELDDMEVEVDVPEEYNHTLPSSLTYYKFFVDGKSNVRVQFRTSSSSNPELFKAGNIYQVEVTGIDRLESKDDANIKLFAGTSSSNEPPEVLEVNALNNTAVEVVFSEPVKGITKSQFEIKDSITISGVSATDSDEIIDKVILYIDRATKMDDDEYKLYIRSGVKDAAGLNSVNMGSGSSNYIEFDGNDEDNEAPFIDSDITVLDSYTIQFEFNEPIKDITSSSFSVKKITGSSSTSVNITKAVLSEDRKLVTLYLNARNAGLDSSYEYELSCNSTVKDLQDLGVDSDERKVEFYGEDIDLEELEIIASYIDEDNKKITLLTNRKLDIGSLSMDDFVLSGAGYYKSSSDKVEFGEKSITITFKNELDGDEELLIEFTSGARTKIKDYYNQSLATEDIEVDTN